MAPLILGVAAAADVLFAEPPNALHPVVWMGRVVRVMERGAPGGDRGRLAYGTLMALALPAVFGGGAYALLALAPPRVGLLLAMFLLWTSFAMRGLAEAGNRVARALEADDLPAGREGLGWLCSREASDLSASEVAAAAAESVSENTSDSVIAPLFWFLLLGVPGAVGYRAINTQDAMIGYRDEKYEYLGKAAARLDDLVNWIPARITALLVLAVSAGRGTRVWWRDAGRTESPNAGHPMAALAGALGIRLEKRGHYVLGDGPEPGPEHVRGAVRVLKRVCAVSVAVVATLGAL